MHQKKKKKGKKYIKLPQLIIFMISFLSRTILDFYFTDSVEADNYI